MMVNISSHCKNMHYELKQDIVASYPNYNKPKCVHFYINI